MPFRFTIDRDADLILTVAEGDLTPNDLVDHARALAAARPLPVRELADFSGVGTLLPTDSVREGAWTLRDVDPAPPGTRLALVTDDDAAFGMLRVFAAHRSEPNLRVEVFRDRGAARGWLDATDPD